MMNRIKVINVPIRTKIMKVPVELLNEADNIRMTEGIPTYTEAFRKIATYSPVGREIKSLTASKFIKKVFTLK